MAIELTRTNAWASEKYSNFALIFSFFVVVSFLNVTSLCPEKDHIVLRGDKKYKKNLPQNIQVTSSKICVGMCVCM